MDKLIGKIAREMVYQGEKKAPIKAIKLKVKFDTKAKSKALKNKKEGRGVFADKATGKGTWT
ncbi:MAG: hypothetical protein KGJ90_04150 [Patescibacteria group bacterium]|nr:hypothetical protein [Patescibacteria group bacterium]